MIYAWVRGYLSIPVAAPEPLALGCDQVQGYIYAKPMPADMLLTDMVAGIQPD